MISRFAGLDTGMMNEAALATSAHAKTYGRGFRPLRVAEANATGVSKSAVASFESTAVTIAPTANKLISRRRWLPWAALAARRAADWNSPARSAVAEARPRPRKKSSTSAELASWLAACWGVQTASAIISKPPPSAAAQSGTRRGRTSRRTKLVAKTTPARSGSGTYGLWHAPRQPDVAGSRPNRPGGARPSRTAECQPGRTTLDLRGRKLTSDPRSPEVAGPPGQVHPRFPRVSP
jgi:hypothetical protein